MTIRLKYDKPGGLFQTEFVFMLFEMHTGNIALVLELFTIKQRETRKHGWKIRKQYDRFNLRYSTITETDVELPDYVKEAALKEFNNRVTVCKWSERNKV